MAEGKDMKKPIYKQWWFWVMIVALILVNILSPSFYTFKGGDSVALLAPIHAHDSEIIRPTEYCGAVFTKKYLPPEGERYF